MDIPKAVSAIHDFLLEAGALALSQQKGIKAMYKDGNQALTETDLAVSKLAQTRFADWLGSVGHVLIDEESIDRTPNDIFANSEYQWVLDPIDGTAGYALGRKMWGISLGVLHNGVPLIGGIYMPALGYFLLSDGDGTYSIDVQSGAREKITCRKMDLHSQIFVESFLGADFQWGSDINQRKVWVNSPESAVQGGVTTFFHQAAGSTLMNFYSIWDVAGIAALAKTSGFKMMSMDDGREWTKFTADDFKENWKLKSNWLLAHPDNFSELSLAIKG